MKVSINAHDFHTPFWISGENLALQALVKQIRHVEQCAGYTGIQIQGADEELQAEAARQEREREDNILARADEIRARREKEANNA